MAKKFLKTYKEAKSGAMKTAGRSFIRGGAIVATAYGVNKLLPMIPGVDKIDPKYMKAVGPGLFLLGMAGEAFINDEHLRAVAEGVSAYGALKSGGDFMPASMGSKADLGLSGVGDEDGAIAASDANWAQILEQADKDNAMKGLEEGKGNEGLRTEKVKSSVTLM